LPSSGVGIVPKRIVCGGDDAAGDNVMVESGRLVAAWKDATGAPLRKPDGGVAKPVQVPDSVALAEEADLIWRWLDRPGVTIVDTERPLDLPATPLPRLTSLAV